MENHIINRYFGKDIGLHYFFLVLENSKNIVHEWPARGSPYNDLIMRTKIWRFLDQPEVWEASWRVEQTPYLQSLLGLSLGLLPSQVYWQASGLYNIHYKRDCKRSFKWLRMQKWKCSIYNGGNLKIFVE